MPLGRFLLGSECPFDSCHGDPTSFLGLHTAFAVKGQTFQLVSGLTAKEPQCLVVEGGKFDLDHTRLLLEPCARAAHLGDGRELFTFRSDGQMAAIMGGKCVAIADTQDRDQGLRPLELVDCDQHGWRGISWKPTPDGEMRARPIESEGDDPSDPNTGECLSLGGTGTAGEEDVGRDAVVAVSSSTEPDAHGPMVVTDGNASSYWASQPDPEGRETLQVDLDERRRISSVDIEWECPAKTFSVETSHGEDNWIEHRYLYRNPTKEGAPTKVKPLRDHVVIDGAEATSVKIKMDQPSRECSNVFGNRRGYAIRNVKINSPARWPVLEQCSVAKKRTDAANRWFLSGVNEFDPCKKRLALDLARSKMLNAL